MQTIYKYKDTEYNSKYLVRQAIWKEEHKIFPEEPLDESEAEAFWSKMGVTIVEIPTPEPPLQSVKARKLSVMNSMFDNLQSECGFMSSVGFKVNGDSTANRNVDMLIRYFPADAKTVSFCAYDNTMHDLTKEELETILQEIVTNAQYIYQQKWAYRNAIDNATTYADVKAIRIEFVCMDFTKETTTEDFTEDTKVTE